jgi:hypothetical protein
MGGLGAGTLAPGHRASLSVPGLRGSKQDSAPADSAGEKVRRLHARALLPCRADTLRPGMGSLIQQKACMLSRVVDDGY